MRGNDMLQVKNLTKIYKTKGGVTVKALDNVTVDFPETGMVFLLGKSGSGKSTLLNVCGGLDSPTEGEIIVKGRSSKAFSQSDFDSYRNTFVGFIFQEYNILNDFSVEDNIALALELQGKPKDKKAIAALLEEVDLTGYAKRKPNTLSGGQKQRIAIARALIKAPEIIMADEPTGALDSATGKQVFDTLKKLSQNKLVLVVSHDRDFAEQYGDRIIELKDGQIISDVSKTQEEQRAVSGNVTVVGSTVCIKKGAELTEKDFDEIKSFLRGVDGDVMIASGEKDVQNFRAVSRITNDGRREVFCDTDADDIAVKEYTPAESKFIRSKLPLRHAVKMGISGVKTKPVRLFFTILLCTVAFVLFGLFSTMTFYDSETTFKQSFKDSNYSTVRLVKEYRTTIKSYHNGSFNNKYYNYRSANFSKEEIESYAEKFGGDSFGAVEINSSISTQQHSSYWSNQIEYLAFLPETNSLRNAIQGNYPTTNNEILLSTYTAEVLVNCQGTNNKGEPLDASNVNDLIGKTIALDNVNYTISGILKTDPLDPKFDPIRNQEAYNWNLEMEFQSEIENSVRRLAFVSEERLQAVADTKQNQNKDDNMNFNQVIDVAWQKEKDGNFLHNGNIGYYSSISQVSSAPYYLNGKPSELADNEVVVSAYVFYNAMTYAIDQPLYKLREARDNAYNRLEDWRTTHEYSYVKWYSQLPEEDRDKYYPDIYPLYNYWMSEEAVPPAESEDFLYTLYNTWKPFGDEYVKAQAEAKYYEDHASLAYLLNNGYRWDGEKGEEIPLTKEERLKIVGKLLAFFEKENIPLEVGGKLYNNSNGTHLTPSEAYTIVGVTNLFERDHGYKTHVYFKDSVSKNFWEIQKGCYEYYDETTTNYVAPENAYYGALFINYDHSDRATNQLHKIYKSKGFKADDSRVYVSCSLVQNIESIDSLIDEMSKIFLIVGIVLAVFAALLLSNFISVSINHKKREIGILRAVGARGLDVFKIFFSESFFIALICTVISTIGTIVLCIVLNKEIGASIGASIFNFGIFSLLSLVGIAVLTAVVATFLPVWNAARKKPVDSIRSA